MRKKRILVCDDDEHQYDILSRTLSASYDVRRSTDYRSVVEDLEKLKPVQLLILDLGFPQGQYVGQECLPDVVKRFPNVKIIVRSDILTLIEKQGESLNLARDLVAYPQVVGFISTADSAAKVMFEVDKALGTPKWLTDGELWILHVSDLQFGGSGLKEKAEGLIAKIFEAIESFLTTDLEPNEPGERKFPFIGFVTGDVTERARPSEFEEAAKFVEYLSAGLAEHRPDMAGAVGKANVIIVPGNHDINWDISRARNLWTDGSGIAYRSDRGELRGELEFLWQYSWLPFAEMRSGVGDEEREWAWQPGYRVINLKHELNILIVAVNSSRWGIDHLSQSPVVPREVWLDINRQLNKIDGDRTAARLLLVHHTLAESESVGDRLALDPSEGEMEPLVSLLSRTCNFAAAFTGHLHKMSARDIDTGSSRRKLIHIGAGTTRSGDLRQFKNPEFNLVRLMDLAPESNKFQRLVVYAFHWDGARFIKYPTFDDGMQWWKVFDLMY